MEIFVYYNVLDLVTAVNVKPAHYFKGIKMQYDLSVIIPAYNESESLGSLFQSLKDFCSTIDYSVQFVFVDDGSTDDTASVIANTSIPKASVKLVKLSRNFGAHEAIRAGIFKADANNIVLYSADMPEPVEDIGLLYKLLLDGNELVYSERLGYRPGLGSRVFAWLSKRVININFPETSLIGVGFGRKIKDELNNNIEASSSIYYQIFSLGFKAIGVPVEFTDREHGKSKWTFPKKIRLFLDVIVMFSYTPIHIISIIGILMFLIGIIWAMIIFINKLLEPAAVADGWPTTASILLIGFGMTNLSLGIIAEYLARTLIASRKRPVFVIEEIIETTDIAS